MTGRNQPEANLRARPGSTACVASMAVESHLPSSTDRWAEANHQGSDYLRILFKVIVSALSLILAASLIGCAAPRAYMAFVYKNGGTLDIVTMTASFPDGIVAKEMVTRIGSVSLSRRFVHPPSWFHISWTTADGVQRETRVTLDGRYTDLKRLDGILIQVVDDRIEVYETNLGENVWTGARRIY